MEKFISAKPYKQWCKARGIDFVTHMQQFPLVAMRMNIPSVRISPFPIKKSTLREKIKNFFKY